MIALISVLALVQLFLCDVVAVGREPLCKRVTDSSSTSKGTPWAIIRLQSCVLRTSCDQIELAISPLPIRCHNVHLSSGKARCGMCSKLNRTARRQIQWNRNVRLWVTHAFLIVPYSLMKEAAVGDGASCYSAGHSSAASATYREARERDQRGMIDAILSKNGRKMAYKWTLQRSPPVCAEHGPGQQVESHVVNAAKLVMALDRIRNAKYERRRCRIERTVRATSGVSAPFSSGVSSTAAATNRAGPTDQVIQHVSNNGPSFLAAPRRRRKATTLQNAGDTLEELPKTLVHTERDVAIGRPLPSVGGETGIFVRPGDPVETPPLPPTRTSPICLSPSLLCQSRRTEGSYMVLDEGEKGQRFQQQDLPQQPDIRSQSTTKANDLYEDRLRGPLSMHEWRDNLASAVNLEGPQDIYVLDFDTTIQLNLREVTHTAIRAWQRLEKKKNDATHESGGRSRCHSTASPLGYRSLQKGTEMKGSEKPRATERNGEASGPPSAGAAVGHRFAEIFSTQRFARMECPAWLEARVRDVRRSIALRGSPDFMVAMRRIVELLTDVEKRHGSTIDSFAERNEKSFQDKWEKMNAAEKVWLVTKSGNFFDIQDTLKFRRGSADATGTRDDTAYPWIVRTLREWEANGVRAALYKRYNTTEAELQQAFNHARALWKMANSKSWNEHVKYRGSLTHVDPTDADRLETYEGFNPAAVWCLNNHINNWRRPVHILSVWEKSAEVLSMLRLMGLSAADVEAARLVHIYGRDTMEQLVAAEKIQCAERQRELASTEGAPEKEGWTLTPSALREEEETACLKLSALRYILRGWRAGKNAWKPVHVVDGSVRSLLALRDSLMIKYVKHSMELVKIMSSPANIPARQWTHGYTSCPPEWMEDYKVRRWLRWCGFIGEEDTVLQDISVPEHPAS